ncbi:RES family NAD+ phosphorylase, partial [Polaromonas sp.]|uniref:RES family NAD+ phosphorylase n=1 Tax=Polaromonas sp. TaxID=1869339 RepID=UPI0025F9D90A
MSLEGLPYGSTLGPGRWHLPPASGLPVVYAASSRALAQLEKRVHANGVAPVKQALIRLELPLGADILDAHNDLALESPRWRLDEGYTQGVGVDWLQSTASLGLWVPSV